MHPQILLHGSAERKIDPVQLRAGSLTLQYEAGFLRYIKVGETEVLRMINYNIRDHNWVTIPMAISDEKIEQDSNGFRISYRSESKLGDIRYHWKCLMRGDEDSTIVFEVEGEAMSSFKRNRLGCTVLHPIKTCAGKHCTITHANNRQEILKFPELINPHQPFFDIREMRWNPTDSVEAFLQFKGEIFETEDQRNWSDASYKTYCTPLSIPFPVDVKTGDKISQAIRLNVVANKTAVTDRKQPIMIELEKQGSTSFPHVGLLHSVLVHDANIIDKIKSLKVDFIRVHVNINDRDLLKNLNRVLQMAPLLELVLFVDEKPEESFIERLLPISDHIKQFIVLPVTGKTTSSNLIDNFVPILRKHFPKAKVGGGTDAFFTDVNRERPPSNKLDFLTFSINPQVHASDSTTMVENLETQNDIVHSCRVLAAGKAIHVGPVTLKIRGTSADPRQLSMFGAAWMLGSFKHLAENGVASITFFETSGLNGIIPHPDESWPETFVDGDDAVYPLYIVLKELLTHKHSRVIKLVSNYPLLVDGLALTDSDGKLTIYLMNFTGKDQLVTLPAASRMRRASTIDDNVMARWIKNPDGQFLMFKEVSTTVSLAQYSITLLMQ
ncbi:MAG TPA: hypothetical protein VK589_05235 [Chryseolinea sp.]|nr:hypothetical protein [Chryseolinea sp.]